MNIYNKFYFIEYTKTPIKLHAGKYWSLQLSKNTYFYNHRNFDFPVAICENYKYWHQYNKFHRLIGPARIVDNHNKFYYIRNKLFKINSKYLEPNNSDIYYYIGYS